MRTIPGSSRAGRWVQARNVDHRYQPQAIRPGALQAKMPVWCQSTSLPNQRSFTPAAPPVYRPQPAPVALQPKMPGLRPSTSLPNQRGLALAAPPVYRPQPALKAQPPEKSNHQSSIQAHRFTPNYRLAVRPGATLQRRGNPAQARQSMVVQMAWKETLAKVGAVGGALAATASAGLGIAAGATGLVGLDTLSNALWIGSGAAGVAAGAGALAQLPALFREVSDLEGRVAALERRFGGNVNEESPLLAATSSVRPSALSLVDQTV